MLASTRMAVLLACLAALPVPVAAQVSLPDTARIDVSTDVAAGMMRYGPLVALGATLSAPHSRIGARFDVMFGVAPDHEIPGRRLVAATAAGILRLPSARYAAPYLLAGADVSLSRYFEPAVGPVAGTGVRFPLGALQPYIEGRFQRRAGFSMLLGLGF
jgi:hypothetical protein